MTDVAIQGVGSKVSNRHTKGWTLYVQVLQDALEDAQHVEYPNFMLVLGTLVL